MKKRYLVIGIIILSYFSLFIGAEDINIMHIFAKNQHKLMIFIMSRIPRLISILIAGVGMSIAGLIMQQISKNKFVSLTTGATIDAKTIWDSNMYAFSTNCLYFYKDNNSICIFSCRDFYVYENNREVTI